jgi:hypothetical protein
VRRSETPETARGELITQRSQVQILSPLQVSAGQRPESIDSGLFLIAMRAFMFFIHTFGGPTPAVGVGTVGV